MTARRWIGRRIPASREYGGVLIVEAVLNGAWKGRLMADTGAAWTCLTPRSLERVGIDLAQPLGSRQVAVAQATTAVSVPTFRLDRIRVGPFEVEGMEVALLELPPQLRLDGLLGVNFLEHFRPTFDFAPQFLVLREGRAL